jgi:glycosyltransferase involved in cell wall biosynthesis
MTPAHLARTVDAIRKAELVHLHFYWDLGNVQVAYLCRLLGVPYVISVHGALDSRSLDSGKKSMKRLYLRFLGRTVFGKSDAIHVDCVHEEEQVKKRFSDAKYWVFPPALEPEVLGMGASTHAPETGLARPELEPKTRFEILYLGRIDPKKGCDVLISAASLLKQRGLEFDLLIAGALSGDDFGKHIDVLVERGNLGGQVRFLGSVSASEKWKLYSRADVFVLPTQQENFGITIFESLSFGTPVVTTENVDTKEELRSSGGVAFSTRSPKDMADSLEILMRDQKALAEMGRKAREFMRAQFSSDAYFEGYHEFYKNVIERRATS